tara:strand:- start:25 stop:372 length:348 start_codon:yes stop_codon:yes gene_type:complete
LSAGSLSSPSPSTTVSVTSTTATATTALPPGFVVHDGNFLGESRDLSLEMAANKQNAEGDEGVLAEWEITELLAPRIVNGKRSQDAERREHGDVPNGPAHSFGSFSSQDFLTVHQ